MDGSENYIGKHITVFDENIEKVVLNETTEWTAEELQNGVWFNDVDQYLLTAIDLSGKQTTISFEIKEMPQASEITADSLDIITAIRTEFEGQKYDMPEERRNELETAISSLETQWIMETGIWNITSVGDSEGTVTVNVINRLNDYSEVPVLILAAYNENGKLVSLKHTNIENAVVDYNFDMIGISDILYYKAFLWKDKKCLMPVAEPMVHYID